MRKCERVPLDWQDFDRVRDWLTSSETYFIGGMSSLYVPSQSTKYLLDVDRNGQSALRWWNDLDGTLTIMGAGEAARTELQRAFPKLKRVGWSAPMIRLLDWRSPTAIIKPYEGETVYTDLVGAYHQLYSRLWLDCPYPRGFGRYSLSGVADALRGWKAARNSVIGVCRSRQAIGWKGWRPIVLRIKNPFLSPALWATIQCLLNEIAYEAVETGAIYVVTDGYYHPVGAGAIRFQEFLSQTGLDYRTDVGPGEFVGWGSYRFGSRQTRLYQSGVRPTFKPLRNIKLTSKAEPRRFISWWKDKASKWLEIGKTIDN